MDHTPETLAAQGWSKHEELSGFSNNVAPFWFKWEGEILSAGFVAQARHCNEHIGTVHGGALMTFADIASGFAVTCALGHSRCATLQLQTHFTAAAREGDFVQCDVEIVRSTRDIIFVRGLMRAKGRNVVGFDGIWKVLAER